MNRRLYIRGGIMAFAAWLTLSGCGGVAQTSLVEDSASTVTVTVEPAAPQLSVRATQRFASTVTGAADTAVSWEVAEAAGGTIDASGQYQAPSAPGTYHVVVTSLADPSVKTTATVTVTAAAAVVAVTVSPKTASITTSGSVQLSAAVSGTSNTVVNWSVKQGASGGTVSAGGLYRPAGAGTFQVVATSAADASKSDSATVTVTAPAGTDLASQLAALARQAIFFDHASVGQNLMDGVRDYVLSPNGSPKPTSIEQLSSTYNPSALTTGVWLDEVKLGLLNGDPLAKIAMFRTDLDNGMGSRATMAFMKFCFVDWNSGTNNSAVFSAYQSMITSAKAAYPNIRFVHFTLPLETSGSASVNAVREAYNVMLRNAYGADVFDLSLYESTNPDGSRNTPGGVPALVASYTSDSGHLNATGQRQISPQLVKFLASLL